MHLDLSSLVSSDQLSEEKEHKVSAMSYLLQKWQVLMWKNVIVRKRHWFLTLFELVIPILLFYCASRIRQIDLFNKGAVEVPVQINRVFTEDTLIQYSFANHDHVIMAYAPNNTFSRRIMEEFNESFVKRQDKIISVDAFDSEVKLADFFHKKFENQSTYNGFAVGCGIVFETGELQDGDIPKDFKYKIRSTVAMWNTKNVFPQFLPAGPTDEGDNYLIEGFVAVQVAIDNAYIKLVGGSKTPPVFDRSVQKFPFPAYKRDLFNDLFKSMMPLITMISFITISISVLKKVVEEKASGVVELMKMMGLKTWMVWAGWTLNGLMVYIVVCAVITFLLCTDFDQGAVIACVHFTVVFCLYIFFCLASIFFCFAISSLFLKPNIAVTVGMAIWFASHTLLQKYIGNASVPFPIQLLLSLVPLYNIDTAYVVIAGFESREVTITWLNLFSDPAGGNGMSLGLVFVMFIAQMMVYMFITWYVTSIHPGPYGRAEPWHFIFSLPSKPEKMRPSMIREDEDDYERYEAPPKDLRVGLKIQELRKVFSNNVVAVDRVNLDIYEGQITALLGHNGAGKTTTMSIITGMYSPTAGSVYAKGYNIFENMDRFRTSLGLCPQHDLLFPYLTAIEHLVFFGMLKGMSMNLARSEGLKLLQMLHVNEKKHVLADKLSGGMKRKLSLAIALIGSPQVLILDEPTSGMDPESRREMWDLLLSLRGERTIIITTHFMEEADVLGDRIAIMDHGKVKCYGTTLFLKKIYGTGYQLTVMKAPEKAVDPITQVIKSSVEGAEVKSMHSGQVTYTVPQEQVAGLPPMFAAIETRKDELGVKGVGISCTTMEEVFLKVGQLAREEKYDFDKTSSHSREPNMLRNTSNEALTYKKCKGLPLIIQQFKSLVHKRSLFTIRRPIASIIFLILPLLLMWVTVKTGLVDVLSGLKDPALTFELSAYGKTDAYVSGPASDQAVYKRIIDKQQSMVTPVTDGAMIDTLLHLGEENVVRYKTQVIVAADFNTVNATATAMYNGLAFHALPISVNLVSNTLLRNTSRTSENTITTINDPLDVNNFVGACSTLNDFSLWLGAVMWLFLVPMGVKGFLMDFIAFPHNERTSNAKQLQLMTGVSPPLYWLACLTWDYLVFLVCSVGVFVIIYLADTSMLFTAAKDYGVLALIFLLYGISGIVCTYCYSFLAKSSAMAGSVFTFVTLVTGCIAPLGIHFAMVLANMSDSFVNPAIVKPLHYILCLEPQYAFGGAILNFAYLLTEHSACKQCDNPEVRATTCATEKNYLEFPSNENANGILEFVLFLAFDWLLYSGIILLIEYGYMSRAVHWLKVQWVGTDFDRLDNEDADVRDERDRVDNARHQAHRAIALKSMSKKNGDVKYNEEEIANKSYEDDSVVLTVDDLAKKFSRSFAAVQGVTFQVSAGECFGLLGVNGAGKTTTFRMLTGDETPTAGTASLLHYSLNDRSNYLAQIGYCPQFDGINGFLTGEEVLRLFANLRGISSSQIQPQIDDWISLLGLEEYRHRQCGKYSGGNKRKLSTAMALIGDPPVVFLDEPTTGVDPVARRNLWDVLARCQKSGQAIVLTSHSMEECEALCTRLTIMVRGRMKCIGSNQYLKQRYGQGYTIMVKLNCQPSQDVLLPQLKDDMHQEFRCTLKDEHKSLLHYHMSDTTMPLSQLFSRMQRLKEMHTIIEDYTVGDTTLEQVFIAFARQAEQ